MVFLYNSKVSEIPHEKLGALRAEKEPFNSFDWFYRLDWFGNPLKRSSGVPDNKQLRLSFQWVFDANAADDLSMVQIFGPQSFTVGAFGGHDDQRIPKR